MLLHASVGFFLRPPWWLRGVDLYGKWVSPTLVLCHQFHHSKSACSFHIYSLLPLVRIPWTWLNMKTNHSVSENSKSFCNETLKLHEPIFDIRKHEKTWGTSDHPEKKPKQNSTKTTSQCTLGGTESDISITLSCHWAKLLMVKFRWCSASVKHT